MTGPSISDAMRRTASASSFDAMGNPASITSTPSTWSWRASCSFSAVFMEKPGGLLAVAQGGVEDDQSVVRHGVSPLIPSC